MRVFAVALQMSSQRSIASSHHASQLTRNACSRLSAQNFSASPKAFVHAGFRLYTMSGNWHCRRAWKTRDCDAHAENPQHASDVFTLARCRVEGASSMVERSVARVRETR
ncbi:hypothetical protein A9975_10050 [Cupriavidus sp. UME77]|nr:hypothetical protein [Cupriavidus sp. UME77]